MLIESLEKKTRLAMVTVMLALGASTVICAACFYFCTSLVREQQNQVYVLDGTIPFMAERSKNEMTFNIEAKAHIQLFHQYFFDLSPDDEYLKWTFSKAMYLADESALRQKQAIEETGFYSQPKHYHRRKVAERTSHTEQSSWSDDYQLAYAGKQRPEIILSEK